MADRRYTVFKPGDVVEVIPSLRKQWLSLCSRASERVCTYTVSEVWPVQGCLKCPGHNQQLRFTNGQGASAYWFDEHTPENGKIRIECTCVRMPLSHRWRT